MCHAEQGAEPPVLQSTGSPLSHVSSKGSASTVTLVPAGTWTCWRYRPQPAMQQQDQYCDLQCWKAPRKQAHYSGKRQPNQLPTGHLPEGHRGPKEPPETSPRRLFKTLFPKSRNAFTFWACCTETARDDEEQDLPTLEGSLLLKCPAY